VTRPPLKTIVVGLDFSETSLEALELARELSERLGSRLVVVHALMVHVAAPALPATYAGEDLRELFTHADEAARRRVEAILVREGLSGRVAVEIRPGDAVSTILDVAGEQDADLIVVGTHGRRGIARLVLGSVAENVVRTAGRPVLAVPHGAAEDAPAEAPE
jgi:nucleotide-binding universal stress UspA family protein